MLHIFGKSPGFAIFLKKIECKERIGAIFFEKIQAIEVFY